MTGQVPVGTGGITLSDVAQAAGVSLATASRVLNGSTRRVAESLRGRVEAAARELGYTANLSAQATARGTSSIIALLVADIADPYFARIASGVAPAADKAGLVMTISITDRDPEREAAIVRTLRGQRPRGIILAASRTAEPAARSLALEIDALTSLGSRVVVLGRGMPDLRSVAIDNFGGARSLGQALAGLGYRHAILLAASLGVLSSDDRVAGFTAGFAEGGGSDVKVYRAGFSRESGWQAMNDALEGGVEHGTVVFGVTDFVAIGAMSALREAGRRIGEDVAVCGFDDIPTSSDVTPPLTTVRVPLEEVGTRALRAVIEEQWDAESAVKLDVIIRDSTPPLHRT